MDEPAAIAEVRARLAALRADREAAAGAVAPGTAPTPDQLTAMRETMGILWAPGMLARVAKGRRAVAAADVVSLGDVWDAEPAAPGGWRAMLAGPVARELTETESEPRSALNELLGAVLTEPGEGQALGFGLAGMRALSNDSYRVLYAIDDERRVVTIVSVDQP